MKTLAIALLVGCAGGAIATGQDVTATASPPEGGNPRGFHGQIVELKYVADSQPDDISSDKPAVADMDLTARARWALEALKRNPRPHLNHECRFSMDLLRWPPCPGPDQHDPITAGDTENRMDWQFGLMKDMCGDSSGDEIARGVRKRIMGHLRDDGHCWVTTGAFARLEGEWAFPWATSKLLVSLCNDYRRTGDETLQPKCRKMFEALRSLADRTDGRVYYAGGNSCWGPNGWAITDATPYNPAMPLEAVATYYETFRDEEALQFAVAFAEGEMARDQWHNWIMRDPSRLTEQQKRQVKLTSSVAIWPTAPANMDLSVRPDGSFDHHSHMRGHSGWGMAHVAAITGEPRLTVWSKRLLDFFLARGTDYGWIPESMTHPGNSETCAVADVASMAAYVAQCGYPEYWDTVERFVRNYMREAQFFFSPEYERLYRQLHPGPEGERGLAMARDFEGAFQGRMGLTDRSHAPGSYDMMGCCVPEGMRALHTAWINTVVSDEDGVWVNMSFDRDAPEAEVTSFLPRQGRMTVRAKVSRDFFLRPPAWAPAAEVKAYRNGKPVAVQWHEAYVRFDRTENGEKLTITYPLVSLVQKHSIRVNRPPSDITVTWRGNTVVKIEPPGKRLPLFEQPPRPLPPLPK